MKKGGYVIHVFHIALAKYKANIWTRPPKRHNSIPSNLPPNKVTKRKKRTKENENAVSSSHAFYTTPQDPPSFFLFFLRYNLYIHSPVSLNQSSSDWA